MTVRWGRCSNFQEIARMPNESQHIPIPQGTAFRMSRVRATNCWMKTILPPKRHLLHLSRSLRQLFWLQPLLQFFLRWLQGSRPGAGCMARMRPVTKNVPKAILRLAGSNTIGDTLGPSLAEAFLKDQGATDVRILPGANPLEKIVEGVLPGDSTASSITIAAHGSATAFTALAGNNCDIGMASRKIKPEEAAKLTRWEIWLP